MRFVLDESHHDFASSIDSMLTKSDMPAVIRSWNDGDTDRRARSVAAARRDRRQRACSSPTSTTESVPTRSTWSLPSSNSAATPFPDRSSRPSRQRRRCSPLPHPRTLAALADGSLATVAFAPHAPYAVDTEVADLVSRRRRHRVVGTVATKRASRSIGPAAVRGARRPRRSARPTRPRRSTSAPSPPPPSCRGSAGRCSR